MLYVVDPQRGIVVNRSIVKSILVFGCGNPLLGDDGFGPLVAERLPARHVLPDCVAVVDAGTAVRDFLFDILLSPAKPLEIFIVDAVSLPGRIPGELMELAPDHIPIPKAADFSLHQFPSVNLLSEISSFVRVRVLAVQIDHIPEFVQPGLSPAVRRAVDPACERLCKMISESADSPRGDGYER